MLTNLFTGSDGASRKHVVSLGVTVSNHGVGIARVVCEETSFEAGWLNVFSRNHLWINFYSLSIFRLLEDQRLVWRDPFWFVASSTQIAQVLRRCPSNQDKRCVSVCICACLFVCICFYQSIYLCKFWSNPIFSHLAFEVGMERTDREGRFWLLNVGSFDEICWNWTVSDRMFVFNLILFNCSLFLHGMFIFTCILACSTYQVTFSLITFQGLFVLLFKNKWPNARGQHEFVTDSFIETQRALYWGSQSTHLALQSYQIWL